jgi:molybdopterin molybdotransferase
VISLDEARAHVLARVTSTSAERISLDRAHGLVLAEPVVSVEAVPPFANTAMDGFAVCAADTANPPVTLELVGTIAAGDAPELTVARGQAARIMTGAPMPEGADAVVMVERTSVDAAGSSVEIEISVEAGNHVRGVGEDVQPGDEVFPAGTLLAAGHLGVLASIGVFEVVAHRRPRVGVLSTGDELVEGPGPLRPGQIRDSNRRSLLALLGEAGFEGVDLGLVRDDESAIAAAFGRGVESCDAVLSSGGVSMGDFDYVKVVLDRIGDMRWMQIAIKPAKPFAFGLVDGVPVFGLPGNPVSSMVSFELLAKPALRAMAGRRNPVPPTVRARIEDSLSHPPDGKTHFVRVSASSGADGVWRVSRSGGQGSHHLTAMARADALAVVPDGADFEPGDYIDILVLDGLR